MRVHGICLAVAVAAFFSIPVSAAPGAEWQQIKDPVAAGWSADGLAAAIDKAATLDATAVMVVHKGKVVMQRGDVARKVNVASVRKSFMSALFGIAASEGKIDLDATLARLGIDDKPALTTEEKQAKIRDLLTARSGVYHKAALETRAMQQNRPARGSHAPGTFWYYNNWDFNTLGGIYNKATGEDIYESFKKRIAEPIGMQDFTPADGRYISQDVSLYPAYLFHLSARDMARFGQLYLDGGNWNGSQVVPAEWVQQSTTLKAMTTEPPLGGYGYLWWTLPPDSYGAGAAAAIGNGGQFITVLPAHGLVVVQTVDPKTQSRGVATDHFLDFVKRIMAAVPHG
jgi:CubicO group peptidase (beta-lactamase class C family)